MSKDRQPQSIPQPRDCVGILVALAAVSGLIEPKEEPKMNSESMGFRSASWLGDFSSCQATVPLASFERCR